jgi:ATP-dependent exoDNAse (exonuclease V) alpha subunit
VGLFKRLPSSLNPSRLTMGEISKAATSTAPKAPEAPEPIEVTEQYEEVRKLIEENHKIIFVTGGAGTGKSTFVRWIEGLHSGKVAIVAPTGIAALTVSGTTIHRFFLFPPAYVVDTDIKINPKSVLPKIEILIIDEISMVNANVLDAIDKSCQLHRKNKSPFGGLTVIMVGDLFQLPPVVTNSTEPLFRREYRSPKFFAAHAFAESEPMGVELSSSFRQKDETLIKLLRCLREGIDLENSVSEFNANCLIVAKPPIGAVHLAPRNKDVDLINSRELSNLPMPEQIFTAKLSGKFSERHLPAPDKVILRAGAQVVMLHNTKEWVNGNIGVVTEIHGDKVVIKLVDSGRKVEVRPHEWKNYDYTFNETSKKVERQVIGTFTQIPVSLAWAMTIHKSQGLTLDKVHVDLGAGAFETGQSYVALSRSRSLETITLARKLNVDDILVDKESIEFYKAIRG